MKERERESVPGIFYSARKPQFRERRNIIDLPSGNFLLSGTSIGLLTAFLKLNPFSP